MDKSYISIITNRKQIFVWVQKTINMDYIRYSQRLKYLLELVDKGQVQSPQMVAERFYCSERTVRNMINRLRELGHDIHYSRNANRYVIKHKEN